MRGIRESFVKSNVSSLEHQSIKLHILPIIHCNSMIYKRIKEKYELILIQKKKRRKTQWNNRLENTINELIE